MAGASDVKDGPICMFQKADEAAGWDLSGVPALLQRLGLPEVGGCSELLEEGEEQFVIGLTGTPSCSEVGEECLYIRFGDDIFAIELIEYEGITVPRFDGGLGENGGKIGAV